MNHAFGGCLVEPLGRRAKYRLRFRDISLLDDLQDALAAGAEFMLEGAIAGPSNNILPQPFGRAFRCGHIYSKPVSSVDKTSGKRPVTPPLSAFRASGFGFGLAFRGYILSHFGDLVQECRDIAIIEVHPGQCGQVAFRRV